MITIMLALFGEDLGETGEPKRECFSSCVSLSQGTEPYLVASLCSMMPAGVQVRWPKHEALWGGASKDRTYSPNSP